MKYIKSLLLFVASAKARVNRIGEPGKIGEEGVAGEQFVLPLIVDGKKTCPTWQYQMDHIDKYCELICPFYQYMSKEKDECMQGCPNGYYMDWDNDGLCHIGCPKKYVMGGDGVCKYQEFETENYVFYIASALVFCLMLYCIYRLKKKYCEFLPFFEV